MTLMRVCKLIDADYANMEARAFGEISRQQRKKHIVPRGEGVEQRPYARHDALARSGLVEFAGEVFEIPRLEPGKIARADAVLRGGLSENPRVGAARQAE